MTQPTVDCPGCRRKVAEKLSRCQFCGTAIARAGPPAAPVVAPVRAPPPPGTEVVHSGFDAKEGVFRVSLSGSAVAMPRCCACCLGSPDGTFPVTGRHARKDVIGRERGTVTTLTYQFPVCAACERHAQGDARTALASFGVVAAALAGVLYLLGQDTFLDAAGRHEPRLSGLLILGVLLVAALFAVVSLKAGFDRILPDPGPGHAGRAYPVDAEIKGYDPSGKPWKPLQVPTTFTFRNRTFGERFREANGG